MSIVERWLTVREQIEAATLASGRASGEVELLAVSKTHSVESILPVVEAGQQSLGENRVQEALEKQSQFSTEVSWHLIGPLQRNKVRKVVGSFDYLQGVDSFKLAEAINRVASELGLPQKIFLQVKIGGEKSKSGFEVEALKAQMEDLLALSSLNIEGLMTIPPPVTNPSEARPFFEEVRLLRDQLRLSSGLPLNQLSMGMSGDYEAAIAEGSTMVRVGSAIFGQRAYPPHA